jgi:hypothetical protein
MITSLSGITDEVTGILAGADANDLDGQFRELANDVATRVELRLRPSGSAQNGPIGLPAGRLSHFSPDHQQF